MSAEPVADPGAAQHGHGHGHMVYLDGEIDISRTSAIGDHLCALVTEHPYVVVMCTSVTFIESRGLAMMARVQRFALEADRQLVWRGLPLLALRAIHLSGLDQYLDIEA